jgi:hypothetical protein
VFVGGSVQGNECGIAAQRGGAVRRLHPHLDAMVLEQRVPFLYLQAGRYTTYLLEVQWARATRTSFEMMLSTKCSHAP